MPKIRKIKTSEREDSRGGGYAKRKFTFEEAEAIREEYKREGGSISGVARKYNVSQPLMYQLIKGTTYNE
jgi:transposase-like protein